MVSFFMVSSATHHDGALIVEGNDSPTHWISRCPYSWKQDLCPRIRDTLRVASERNWSNAM